MEGTFCELSPPLGPNSLADAFHPSQINAELRFLYPAGIDFGSRLLEWEGRKHREMQHTPQILRLEQFIVLHLYVCITVLAI